MERLIYANESFIGVSRNGKTVKTGVSVLLCEQGVKAWLTFTQYGIV